MAEHSDDFPGLRASRLCAITGVRPQTRDDWVRRGLLDAAPQYRELDVIEQAVLKGILNRLPKSHIPLFWFSLRKELRAVVPSPRLTLVWDPEIRVATIARDTEQLVDAVRHGRPVYAVPLGELIVNARSAYRREVEALLEARRARRRPAPARRRGALPGGGK